MTRDELLAILWENADTYISGAQLARRLSVSRTAVWKQIEQLRGEGYLIESVTNKGYRLSSRSDVLSAAGIERYLEHPNIRVQVRRSVSSTITVLKEQAEAGAPEGTALVAEEQTKGRGRMGRSFYSPPGTGVYLSLLLRPDTAAAEAVALTACAAVAVAESVESLSGHPAQIKWINDVLMDGKKICGILTEASVDFESGMLHYAVVGIGINVLIPPGGFPPELQDRAGAVFGTNGGPALRCRMAAAVLDLLMGYYERLGEKTYYEGYKQRSVVLGRPILLLTPGHDPVPAQALDIDRDFALVVRLADGTIRHVNSGEVSIRPGGPDF